MTSEPAPGRGDVPQEPRIGWWYPGHRLDEHLHLLREVHAMPPRLTAWCGMPLTGRAPGPSARSRWCAPCLSARGLLHPIHAPSLRSGPGRPVEAGLSILAGLHAHEHLAETGSAAPAVTTADLDLELQRALRLLRASYPPHTARSVTSGEHAWLGLAHAAALGVGRALRAALDTTDTERRRSTAGDVSTARAVDDGAGTDSATGSSA